MKRSLTLIPILSVLLLPNAALARNTRRTGHHPPKGMSADHTTAAGTGAYAAIDPTTGKPIKHRNPNSGQSAYGASSGNPFPAATAHHSKQKPAY
jgi:hypothetical protein